MNVDFMSYDTIIIFEGKSSAIRCLANQNRCSIEQEM
jgi:hypothetical protein